MDHRVAVAGDPRQIGKALQGPLGDLWCYRVGDYRVICEIQDSVLTILLLQLGNRREVYR
jgi:mRNA interferase RelE/StbE